MRIFSLALVLVLAACGQPRVEGPPGDSIACDLTALGEFAQVCTAERKGSLLIVHHPDGGFRRFNILSNEPGIAVADGADQLSFAPDGPYFDVFVGNDPLRYDGYRLPNELKIVETEP